MRKLTIKEFILKAKEIHGNKYDYSLVKYINSNIKICIKYKNKIFWQRPNKHLQGQGFPFNKKMTKKEYLSKVQYNCDLINYKNLNSIIIGFCIKHGEFNIKAYDLLHKGCPKCNIEKRSKKRIKMFDDFLNEANEIHDNKYKYIKESYVDSKTKMKIICPIHGIFEQLPNNHIIKKYGCPICKESKGEKEIRQLLEENNIEFISQYKLCKNPKTNYYLLVDFFLPKYNLYIEYNGIQHYEEQGIYTKEKVEITKEKDQIKRDFAKINKIGVIEISYKDNIKDKIAWLWN